MDETPIFEIPFPEETDDATVPAHMEGMANRLEELLGEIAPGQITGPTAGQLLIANSSGTIVGTTISGDATIDDDGELTLANNSVGTNQLENNAVDTSKVANGAITRPKVGTWIQTATASVSGTSGTTTLTWPEEFGNSSYRIFLTPQSGIIIDVRLICSVKSTTGIEVKWVASGSNAFTINALGVG